MAEEIIDPTKDDRKRILLLGAMTSAYYDADTEEERSGVVRRFRELAEEWRELGARVVGTFDDDLFMVGEPSSTRFTFYLLFEADDFSIAADMLQRFREPVNGIRMDRYVRFEVHLGRPFFPLEGT
jgi:hypothetical protein